jgi:hypothetical protein
VGFGGERKECGTHTVIEALRIATFKIFYESDRFFTTLLVTHIQVRLFTHYI